MHCPRSYFSSSKARNVFFKVASWHPNVRWMLVLRIFNGFCVATRMSSVYDTYVHELAAKSNTLVGLVASIAAISSFLVAFPAGWLVDHYRQHRATILKFCGMSTFFCIILDLIALNYDCLWMVAASGACWASWYQFTLIASESLFVDSIVQGERAFFLTLRKSLSTLAGVLGPLLSIILFRRIGDRWSMPVLHVVLQTGTLLSIPEAISLMFWYDVEGNETSEDSALQKQKQIVKGRQSGITSRLGVDASAIPYICYVANLIFCFGAGMTVKYINLFFRDEYNLKPISLLSLGACYILSIFTFSWVAQVVAKRIGRAQTSLLFTTAGTILLLIFIRLKNLPLVVIVYLIRGGCQNATGALDRSIIMDFVSVNSRGRWNAFESLNILSWSLSALYGGHIADKQSYRRTFQITAAIYICANLIYLPLIWLVPKQEKFEISEHRQNVKSLAPIVTELGTRLMDSEHTIDNDFVIV
eukprot:GHVL01023826.1.p1 GENE.GHVL01023826.1~~GHVL01023826.1.p1  ORF type:complete len:473 (+),score=38.46 GHVL01023826.1:64-1482(+)